MHSLSPVSFQTTGYGPIAV